MKVIQFKRPFTATRIIKGKFLLADAEGEMRQGFAFRPWTNCFEEGCRVTVSRIKGNLLVIQGDAALGEVVLDGAEEDVDFQVESVVPVESIAVTSTLTMAGI